MKVIIKQWIYEEAQNKAQRYNFTLCWGKIEAEIAKILFDTEENIFSLYGKIEKETEKAILFSFDYWNLNRAGRYVTDAPRCNGFKVWIPKSAIIKTIESK